MGHEPLLRGCGTQRNQILPQEAKHLWTAPRQQGGILQDRLDNVGCRHGSRHRDIPAIQRPHLALCQRDTDTLAAERLVLDQRQRFCPWLPCSFRHRRTLDESVDGQICSRKAHPRRMEPSGQRTEVQVRGGCRSSEPTARISPSANGAHGMDESERPLGLCHCHRQRHTRHQLRRENPCALSHRVESVGSEAPT